ncbi:YdcF family protein [Sphingobacterium sp. 1.A.5]|uniref:YdcF family protein n=1 Tax=Sphingobacterium sp. 1.A.5 TaxID=2044604 RepID=UPI000C0BC878|nr:YdcF family protein [Sphingobacterium sp. 1.A.5]
MKTIINRIMVLVFGICFVQISKAQENFQPQNAQDWVLSKNYFASYILFKDTELSKILFSDERVKSMLSERRKRFDDSKDCKDLACMLQAFKWENNEIAILNNAVVKAYESNNHFKSFVENRLIPSNRYGLNGSKDPKEYVSRAIQQDMKNENYVIDVYAGGRKPNYPRIDSISFDVSNKSYLLLLKDVRQDVLKDTKDDYQSSFITMLTAVRLLEINERMDAAQLEPLIDGENKAALEAIKKADFNKYPYSLLLVLGAGPNVYDQPISPGGMLRARMAARAYFEGQAPFIVLSGGRVHPYKTPYIEAIEMKRYLIQNLMVPESAIILDPHARHTTTNMRNTARIMLTYGFPNDKYAIVTSSEAHINAVVNMADRCIKELGYVPYELGKRVNDVVLEFKPNLESFIIDGDEPLDP